MPKYAKMGIVVDFSYLVKGALLAKEAKTHLRFFSVLQV